MLRLVKYLAFLAYGLCAWGAVASVMDRHYVGAMISVFFCAVNHYNIRQINRQIKKDANLH